MNLINAVSNGVGKGKRILSANERDYAEECALSHTTERGIICCRGLNGCYCLRVRDEYYLNCPFKKSEKEGYRINSQGYIYKKGEIDNGES